MRHASLHLRPEGDFWQKITLQGNYSKRLQLWNLK